MSSDVSKVVPVEPVEEMLRAALDTRYCRSKRSQRVKETYPGGYETWLKTGLVRDAPAIAEEYKAMLAAAPKQDVVSVPRDVFDRTLEYFEGREDASTDSGKWQGNEEMYLLQDLRAADKEGKP